MSRDSKLKWTIIAATLLTNLVLILAWGLRFPLRDAVRPLAVSGLFGLLAVYYRYRGEPKIVDCFVSMIQMFLYTANYTVLMYVVAALAWPLRDNWLMSADELLGVHLPSIVVWSNTYPTLKRVLDFIYDTVLMQTVAVMIGLAFLGDRRALQTFVLRFMLCSWMALALFAVMPAEGPFSAYGYSPNEIQSLFLEHFHGLRDGSRTLVTWREAAGLITFPSFHVTWALLLTIAVWHRRVLFVPLAVINLLVCISTLTTGWHYSADVLGGMAVALAGVLLTRWLEPWLTATVPGETSHA